MIRAHIHIQGHVQGVGYRASTRRKANQFNLKGWVRNLPDGSVEAVVEGSMMDVNRLITWCRRGPTMAHVTKVRVEKSDAIGEFHGFLITSYRL